MNSSDPIPETDAWELFWAIKQGKPVKVVDGRSPEAFAREHIPGALNLPLDSLDTGEAASAANANAGALTRKLTPSLASLDPTILYVSCDDGIDGDVAERLAHRLQAAGLNVQLLVGGVDWWRRDGYSTEGENAQTGTRVGCGCGRRG